MSMAKPIVSEVTAFDATQEQTFYFTTNDGDQVVKNTILIVKIEDETETVVYTNTVESYEFSQTVPANTLNNGEQYSVTFKTYGIDSSSSEYGTYVPFKCYKTPTLSINIIENQKITESQYTFKATYSQQENELIDYIYFELYRGSSTNIDRSDNLYNTSVPPLECEYTYTGLTEGLYSIKAICLTIEGTVVETRKIPFVVIYNSPSIFSSLELKPYCDAGYINIKSNLINIIGIPNHNPVKYDDGGTKLELINCNYVINGYGNKNVVWDKGYSIPKNKFLLRCRFTPCDDATVMILGRNEVKINFERGQDLDYINILTKNGGVITTNGVPHINTQTELGLLIKVDGAEWETRLDVLSSENTILNFNESSNIDWNMMIDRPYIDNIDGSGNITYTEYGTFVVPEQNQVALTDNINYMLISNGVYDYLNITTNIDYTYDEHTYEDKEWDYDTIFSCDFNSNLDGGNIDSIMESVTAIRIKRRDENTKNWITIFEREITSADDFNISINDSFIPSDIEQTYALVPMTQGIEGDYITNSTIPHWKGTFISDASGEIHKLYSGISYGSKERVKPRNIFTPIGRKYPIIVCNSEINYNSGSTSGYIYGYNFEKTRRIDRLSVVKQTMAFEDFLNTETTKVITDWNGNIWVVGIIDSTSIEYNDISTNGTTIVSFSWVEQGKYNNYEDLVANNLIKGRV